MDKLRFYPVPLLQRAVMISLVTLAVILALAAFGFVAWSLAAGVLIVYLSLAVLNLISGLIRAAHLRSICERTR